MQSAKISCRENALEDKFEKINRRENKLIYSSLSIDPDFKSQQSDMVAAHKDAFTEV